VNGDGSLSKDEVHRAFKTLVPTAAGGGGKDEGEEDEENEFDVAFASVDKDEKGGLSFEGFQKSLFYLTLFHELDEDISGSLDKSETRAAFARLLGKEMTDAAFETAFVEMDEDGDGVVSFAEMKRAFFEKKRKDLARRREGKCTE
jgi:Ca2+-binding EF-hand superfamily protein